METIPAYRELQRDLCEFDDVSIVFRAASKCFEFRSKSISEWQNYLPWELLLLTRWAYVFCESSYPHSKVATEYDLNRLINKVKVLSEQQGPNLIKSSNALAKFMRTLAFQQFWHQETDLAGHLGRQVHLFSRLTDRNGRTVESVFQNKTGLTCLDFLTLALTAWMRFLPNHSLQFIDYSWFQPIDSLCSKEKVEAFFNLLSASRLEIKTYLRSLKEQPLEYQLLEASPLRRYPFLRIDNKHFVYSPFLIQDLASYFVYDFLKIGNLESGVLGSFGDVFEKYIQLGLDHSNAVFIPEGGLRQLLGRQHRVVDYVVPGEEGTLFIEAKGIEMRFLARLDPSDEVMRDSLEDSIIKGVVQGMIVANRVIKNPPERLRNLRQPFFLLLVTYKELYLGSGSEAWSEFLEEAVLPHLRNSSITEPPIKPDHIFFISVKDYDRLIQAVGHDINRAFAILKAIIILSKEPVSRKLVFGMYLDELDKAGNQRPQYIQEGVDSVFTKVQAALEQYESNSKK
ncbi:MAG TPA: hypothetical protein DCS07_01335 [Bdellovibrionales bacterium]|nr:MAG: hypothetical protein A2Z97_04200 [Bdellovibrionales bacterium GWB1_52_6]OFZ02437.1 MAG: hypothetical protein A2X97_12875 [Bdellovibrionales bacterium GWA1_52_35]OFZ39324.1 MAG: hypothetical protein A2070_00655 [Bdellovibrionales bacterium GWC1_52_8]HAR41269.1 hypothetical protein [Bdellovibrionales bacterium]HCM41535.1 hypothetical protein [Bdellovibrionales bacterium]